MPWKQIGMRNSLPRFAFYVRFKGERHRQTVACPQSVVRSVYREWEQKIFSGAKVGHRRLHETLKEYQAWSGDHKSPGMVRVETIHCRDIAAFFKDVDLTSIARPQVLDLRAWKKRSGVAPATINRLMSTLSFFFNWCIERGYLSTNPAFRVRLPEMNARVVTLEPAQIQEMLLAANPYQLRWLHLALFTGMRHGEIGGLRWNQVNLNAGLIQLEAKETKGKRDRIIPMPQFLVSYLHQLRSDNPAAEYVVGDDQPVKSFKTSWNNLRKDLPWMLEMKLRVHDLRHVYATILRMQGVDLHEVKELLGHRDIATTQRYAHYDGSVRREKVDRIEQFIFGSRKPV